MTIRSQAETNSFGYSGDVTFTYRLSDGLLSSGDATVTITMTGNLPPDDLKLGGVAAQEPGDHLFQFDIAGTGRHA